jgi:flagellar biosynthetic protein FlhB
MGEEKTEPATDHKRQEARKSGNVLKSQDAIVAALLFAFAYSISFVAQNIFRWCYGFFVETFENLHLYTDYELTGITGLLLKACLVLLISAAPMAAIAFLIAWLGNFMQVGVLITTKPLNAAEGLKKLNPIKGFKNIFSMKKVIELGKAFVKLIVITWIFYGAITDMMGPILQTSDMSIPAAMSFAGSLVLSIGQKVALAMVAIAGADWFLQRWQYNKSLKMSRKEIMDEYKKLEGDPHVKGRLRQKQMEMAMNAGRGSVAEADVVITNPTHYAVAIEYKPKKGQKAPVVLAKGKNAYALEIRRIAEENFILIVEDPPLARMLYAQVEVEQPIPPELFQAVAKIIALLYKGRRRPQAQQPVLTEIPSMAPPVDLQAQLEAPNEAIPPSSPQEGTVG